MGLTGLEPVTLRLSSACSNQLSYRPGKLRGQFIVRSEIRNAISENWRQGDYAPASASDNVPCLLDVCLHAFQALEARGFEPLTSSLQSWRSTN
jgi:hypothetical protein